MNTSKESPKYYPSGWTQDAKCEGLTPYHTPTAVDRAGLMDVCFSQIDPGLTQ